MLILFLPTMLTRMLTRMLTHSLSLYSLSLYSLSFFRDLVQFTTKDESPPVLSIAVDQLAKNSARLSTTLDEPGKVFYAVRSAADPAPSASEVRGQTTAGGVAYPEAEGGPRAVSTPGTPVFFDLAGLDEAQFYSCDVVAEDNPGNQAAMQTRTFQTPDLTGPSVYDHYMKDHVLSATTANANFKTNEDGDVYVG